MALLAGARAVPALIAAALLTAGLGRAAAARLGGLTGDVYGATGELVFASTALLWVVAL